MEDYVEIVEAAGTSMIDLFGQMHDFVVAAEASAEKVQAILTTLQSGSIEDIAKLFLDNAPDGWVISKEDLVAAITGFLGLSKASTELIWPITRLIALLGVGNWIGATEEAVNIFTLLPSDQQDEFINLFMGLVDGMGDDNLKKFFRCFAEYLKKRQSQAFLLVDETSLKEFLMDEVAKEALRGLLGDGADSVLECIEVGQGWYTTVTDWAPWVNYIWG